MEEKIEQNTNEKEINKSLITKIIIYVLIGVICFTCGWFGNSLLTEDNNKKDNNSNELENEEDKEQNENFEQENNSTDNNDEENKEETTEMSDSELISNLENIVSEVEENFSGKDVTSDLEMLESKYFTENGKNELMRYKRVMNTYCLDPAACGGPPSIFKHTGVVYDKFFIYEKNNDTIVLGRTYSPAGADKWYFDSLFYTTFKKENGVWKIDSFINEKEYE